MIEPSARGSGRDGQYLGEVVMHRDYNLGFVLSNSSDTFPHLAELGDEA